ncbi:MAG: hypothetical protein JWO37_2906 [Acidimicrobiales bacterium]|nr:hypothetical protein [Acidimicrobiales bacterium]
MNLNLLYIASIVLIAGLVGWDCERRGRVGAFWFVLTLIAFPVGLVGWMVGRSKDRYVRADERQSDREGV